jgi:FkbM family methyltransferase
MVEPVPDVFMRLRQNYEGLTRVTLENAAVAAHDGRLRFYHLAHAENPEAEGLPAWYDAIGSFSREHVLAHRVAIPDIERRLVETTVPCLTFRSLCEKHGLDVIDLLLIDAEGYDYEVLKHVDLSRHRPALVVYEHRHLDPRRRAACLELMRDSGYQIMEEGYETWCLRRDSPKRLLRKWRRLHPALPAVAGYEEAWLGRMNSSMSFPASK